MPNGKLWGPNGLLDQVTTDAIERVERAMVRATVKEGTDPMAKTTPEQRAKWNANYKAKRAAREAAETKGTDDWKAHRATIAASAAARDQVAQEVADGLHDPKFQPLRDAVGQQHERAEVRAQINELRARVFGLEAGERNLLNRIERLERPKKAGPGDELCERCAGTGRLYQMQPGNYQFLPVKCDACHGSGRAAS